jgi:hypothetical protein
VGAGAGWARIPTVGVALAGRDIGAAIVGVDGVTGGAVCKGTGIGAEFAGTRDGGALVGPIDPVGMSVGSCGLVATGPGTCAGRDCGIGARVPIIVLPLFSWLIECPW